jgi:phosphoenolpyruvate carboxykinase (GTP)
VLEWVFRRCDGEGEAHETPIGLVPPPSEINREGLRIEDGALEELLQVDPSLVAEQLPQVEEFLAKFGDRLPSEIRSQLEALKQRLG